VLLVAWLVAGPSSAQEAEGDVRPAKSRDIEEVLITGQILEAVSQDDDTSAVGFDHRALDDIGVQDIRDLSAFTPNLSIKTAFAAVNPTLFIRGVGLDDFNANSASAVSVYADGVYMYSPAGQLFGLFDVENLTVLRGPQPELTNANAGAIQIQSVRPSDDFNAYLTTTLGTPSRSGFAAGYNERTLEGALNVPLIPEVAALRMSFKWRTRDGFVKNECAPRVAAAMGVTDPLERNAILGAACNPATGESRRGPLTPPSKLEEYVNDVDNWGARALLSFNMPLGGGQEIDWLLNVNGGQNRSLATQFQHTGLRAPNFIDHDGDPDTPTIAGPQTTRNDAGRLQPDRFGYTEEFSENDAFRGEYDRVGPEKLDLLGASLTGMWYASDLLEVESLTAWVWHDRKTYANDDGGPRIWFDNDYLDESNQFSEELRLRLLFADEGYATLGGSFLWERLTGQNVFRDRRLFIPNGFQFDQDFRQTTIQWGIFGQVHTPLSAIGSASFLEDFDLDGTVRFNWAKKDFSQESILVRGAAARPTNVGAERDTWTAISGSLSLTYNLTDDANTYVKYSRGWKPGHFNLGTLTSGEPLTPVKPETVDSIEVGVRTTWLDGLLTANLTAFWYDYTDLQVFQTTTDPFGNILRRLINAESASIQGVEVELSASPLDGLELSANAAWLDSEYDEFGTTFPRTRRIAGSSQTVIIEQDYSGNRLIASPEWSFSAQASYSVDLGRFGWLRPWYVGAYQDDVFFDPNEGKGAEGTLVQELLRERGYWLHNAGITYTTPSEQIEVGFWVRNFLDETYRVQSFDLSVPNQFVLDVYGAPRTAGMTVSFRYE